MFWYTPKQNQDFVKEHNRTPLIVSVLVNDDDTELALIYPFANATK